MAEDLVFLDKARNAELVHAYTSFRTGILPFSVLLAEIVLLLSTRPSISSDSWPLKMPLGIDFKKSKPISNHDAKIESLWAPHNNAFLLQI